MSPSLETSSQPPKTVIKGFSFSAKPKTAQLPTKATTSTTLGKRPRAALHNDSDSDDDERPVVPEVVTGFDIREGGALKKDEKSEQALLVIPKMKNRDWREEMRRKQGRTGKNLLPAEVQAEMAARARGAKSLEGGDVVNDTASEPQWGLTITKRRAENKGGRTLITDEVATIIKEAEPITEALPQEVAKEKIDDERALEALLGVGPEKKGPDLVIAAQADEVEERYSEAGDEEDAYRRAIKAAPEVSTLDDYERMPVEEFGAALLRGMGWKEGKEKERPKEVKRRQNLLGLGATELKDAEELGAWVQKSDTKRLKSSGPSTGARGIERRPKSSEYKSNRDRERDYRDSRNGGSYRRDMDRDRDRDYRRDRDRRRL